MTTDHTALIARLERGETGPQLDVLIHVALHPDDTVLMSDGTAEVWVALRDLDPSGSWDWPGLARAMDAKPVTTSLDACAAAMPEGWELVSLELISSWNAVLVSKASRRRAARVVRGASPTMCGAWSAAILRAKGGA